MIFSASSDFPIRFATRPVTTHPITKPIPPAIYITILTVARSIVCLLFDFLQRYPGRPTVHVSSEITVFPARFSLESFVLFCWITPGVPSSRRPVFS